MALSQDNLDKGFEICKGISLGKSVKRAAEEIGATEPSFFRWLTQSKELAEEYMRVRLYRADARYESIDAIIDELKTGQIDSNTARVIIDTIKWQCGKEKGGVYGDSTQIRHANAQGTDDANFHVGVSFIEAGKPTDTEKV